MKAIAVKPGKEGFELIEVDEPKVEKGKVKLKTLYVGICGTDKAIVNNALDFVRAPPGEDKLIIGHEGLAEVVEVGEGVNGLKEGDLVVPIVRRGGNCFHSRFYRQDYCEDDSFVEAGIRGLHGFMREYFVDEPQYLVKVKDKDLGIYAVLTEPAKNVMKIIEVLQHAVSRYYEVCEDSTLSCLRALIAGWGTEGALLAMALKFVGIEDITAFSRSESEAKTRVAELLNVNYFTTKGEVADVKGFDLFFDMTGDPRVVVKAVEGIRNNGIIVLFGTNNKAPSQELKAEIITKVVEKNLTIVGSVDGSKGNYEQGLALLSYWYARNKEVLDYFVEDAVYYPEQFGEALKHKGLKAVIKW